MGGCTNSVTIISGNCNHAADRLAGRGGWPVATGSVLQDFLALTILGDGGKFASIKRLRHDAANCGSNGVEGGGSVMAALRRVLGACCRSSVLVRWWGSNGQGESTCRTRSTGASHGVSLSEQISPLSKRNQSDKAKQWAVSVSAI